MLWMGKHRLALVCDPDGKILARSVLRLLLDDEGKPVIFQEKMYVADANPVYPQLLRQMALKKAGLLGVPLVVSPADFEKEQAKKYPLSIQAKAKPEPFESVRCPWRLAKRTLHYWRCSAYQPQKIDTINLRYLIFVSESESNSTQRTQRALRRKDCLRGPRKL